MNKVKKEIGPNYNLELFNTQKKGYESLFKDQYNTTKFGKHSIKHLGLYIWSRLSNDDRKKPSITSLTKNIRAKYLSNLIEDKRR